MKERLLYLDIIRGLAITGILFVNVISFGWPELYDSNPSAFWTTPLEQFIHEFLRIFIQSNFYPVFAMLFGISLTFVFKSAVNKGLNPNIIFSRRLFFLLVIGATHAFLIWYGDILLIYAILGYLLLLFYRYQSKVILIAAASLWVIPNLLYGIFLFLTEAQVPTYNNAELIHKVITNNQISLYNVFIQNNVDWSNLYTATSIQFVFISIFPMFLFGLYFAKSQWITKISLNQYRYLRIYIFVTSGLLGFTLKIVPMLNQNSLILHHLSEAFGGPLIGFFYVMLVLILISETKITMNYFNVLGRMSMTNYLFQSTIGYIIFKFIGFYGLLSPIPTLILAMVILAIQVFFSNYWLKRNSYGPIEGVWRKYTYPKA